MNARSPNRKYQGWRSRSLHTGGLVSLLALT